MIGALEGSSPMSCRIGKVPEPKIRVQHYVFPKFLLKTSNFTVFTYVSATPASNFMIPPFILVPCEQHRPECSGFVFLFDIFTVILWFRPVCTKAFFPKRFFQRKGAQFYPCIFYIFFWSNAHVFQELAIFAVRKTN